MSNAHKKLRLCFFIFQTGRLANGGIRSITEVIEGIKEFCDITIITQVNNKFAENWRDLGVSVIVLDGIKAVGQSSLKNGFFGLCQTLIGMCRTNLWLWRFFLKNRFHVVHCNDPAPFWYSAIACFLYRIPLILNLRDTKERISDVPIAKYRLMAALSRKILVLSNEMQEFYSAALPAVANKITFIYSVVNVEEQERSVDSASLAEENYFSIGYVATFNDKKNQLNFLLKAGPALRADGNIRVHFLGDFDPSADPYALECYSVAKDLGLETFRFEGCVSKVSDWYKKFDLVVVPTKQEGLARCMIESIACGTPVVSFDVCSAREILDGYHCGRVIPQGSYDELVDAILQLKHQPELLVKLGQNGKSQAKILFEKKGICGHYINLYNAVAFSDCHRN